MQLLGLVGHAWPQCWAEANGNVDLRERFEADCREWLEQNAPGFEIPDERLKWH
jgi:hypothetical protein